MINKREGWTGCLWQGRFGSCAMDEAYLRQAVRYVEMNPVEAGLVTTPWDYRWSSAAAHVDGRNDSLVRVQPMLDRVSNWKAYLAEGADLSIQKKLLRHQSRGLPAGDEVFISRLEATFGRPLRLRKPGRQPRGETN
jgi:putative transposase